MSHPVPGDPRRVSPHPVDAVRAEVRAAIDGLAALHARPVVEHVEAFERVHAALGSALAEGAGPESTGGS